VLEYCHGSVLEYAMAACSIADGLSTALSAAAVMVSIALGAAR
jgi:hypothetical protein